MKTYINTIKLFIRTPSVAVPYFLLLLGENVFLIQILRSFVTNLSDVEMGKADAYFFFMDLSYFLFLPFLFFLFIGYEFMRKSKEAGLDEVLDTRGCKNGWIEFNQLLVLMTAVLLYAVLFTVYTVTGYRVLSMTPAFLGEMIRMLLINVLLLALASASMGYLISRLSKRFAGYLIVLAMLFLVLPNTVILFLAWQEEYHIPLFWLRDIVCLLPPDITAVGDTLYGLPLEWYRVSGMLFWISIAVLICVRKWFCTRKRIRRIVSCGMVAVMVLCAAGALNKGSILLMAKHPDSATRKDSLYYLEHEPKEKEAGFDITDYDMSLKFGRELSAEVTVTLRQEQELSEYLFTLYHGYKIKEVMDEKGEEVTFRQEGDYVTIENNKGVPVEKLTFTYRGFSPMFYSNRKACFLPGIFPYYPKAGFGPVYRDGMYVCDNAEKAKYRVAVSGLSVVGNLAKKGDILEGTAENVTLVAGYLEERSTDRSRQIIYPFQESSYEIAEELSVGRLRMNIRELEKFLGISGVSVPDEKTLIVIPGSLSFYSRMESYYEFEDYIMTNQSLDVYEILEAQVEVLPEKQELKDIFFEIAPTKDYNPYEEQLMRENSPFPEVDYSGSLELRDEVIEKMRKLGTQKVAREIYRYLTDSANTEAPLTFVKNLE